MYLQKRSMTKIAGSGAGSGSICQRHVVSADPDRTKMSRIRNTDFRQFLLPVPRYRYTGILYMLHPRHIDR
jgi:hypothetical protein